MQLKKCTTCNTYTLLLTCNTCHNKTTDPHYTFKKIKDAPKDSAKHFAKKRAKKS